MKFLFVGLGNIGVKYKDTRHNIGFDLIDNFIAENHIEEKIDKYGILSNFKYKGRIIYLLKPTTYMNNSGKAVKYWKDKLKISITNILILLDDLHLPFGKLRLKPKGSSAGHNGLKSIEEYLNTREFSRLKIGIGNNFNKGKQDIFVLEKFTEKENIEIPSIISQANQIASSFAFNGLQETMNKYN